MTLPRWLCLFFGSLPILSGCLQVELNGPVAGARVSVQPLRGGAPIVTNITTSDVQQVEQRFGADEWAGYSDALKAALLGLAELPQGNFADTQYYLVTASGGVDRDGDNNGRIDPRGVPVDRPLHAIMSGAQLKHSFNRVTMLSEAIYQLVEPDIATLTDRALGMRLNQLARKVVGDVNSDSLVNYVDVLRWSNFFDRRQYKGAPEFLARLPRAISDTAYSEDIIFLDSFNAIENARWWPAVAGTPWQDDIVGCTAAIVFGDLCNFRTLPLAGLATPRPTVTDIMARLVTSHPWIAPRFEQLLQRMPEDILLLFRSVTAIVIGTNIRPSYYDPGTGAIYLDADYFWLTAAERGSVSDEPDYRVAFSEGLRFIHLWRYVKDNRDTYTAFSDGSALGYRQVEDIELEAARLLFHELGHAADAFRPVDLPLIASFATPYTAGLGLVSDTLEAALPLQSTTLASLANVMFYGAAPTSFETRYTAAQVGDYFAADRASDLYSYASQYEDLAMLFEEAMMALHYGVQRDVAFTSAPQAAFAGDVTCADLRVGWGIRGRIVQPRVLERARLAIAELLPERNYTQRLQRLPAAVPLRTDTDWCSSVEPANTTRYASERASQQVLPLRQWSRQRFP